MVPEDKVWNYHFMGHKYDPKRQYKLSLENPKDFYDESHRTQHFIQFTDSTAGGGGQSADAAATSKAQALSNIGHDGDDREDLFA